MENLRKDTGLWDVIGTDGLCMVQFGSSACRPCAAIRQKLEHWQKQHPTVRGVYVAMEQFPEEAAGQGVFSVPTVMLFAEGRLTLRESGYFSVEQFLRQAERLVALLDQYR